MKGNWKENGEQRGNKMDKEFIVMITGVIGVICLMYFGAYLIDKKQCYTKYNDFQPEYVGIITGCMVQYNGKTVPVESLRVME